MRREDGAPWVRLTPRQRLQALALALVCVAALLAGRGLTPDARGWGTHEQLGLAPCRMMTFLHVPCPFCGMTTAFAHMARGDVMAAMAAQPAGAVLFIVVGLAGLAAGLAAVVGWRPVSPVKSKWAAAGLGLLMGGAWVYTLAAHLMG